MDQEMNDILQDAYRPGTKQNLRVQFNTYFAFCDRYNLVYAPAHWKQLTRFAVYLHKYKKLKPDTIANYVAAVRSLHGLMELPVPDTSGFLHQLVLKGIKARNKIPTRKVRPMDPFIFRLIRPHVNM